MGVKLSDVLEQWRTMASINTGALSVSDPQLGVTESPLGDATLLPVITLQALQHMDNPAKCWIGYTPTHQGFQFLQEAFQRGEWIGHVPQFRLPQAFREAGVNKLPNWNSTEQGSYEMPIGSTKTWNRQAEAKIHNDDLDKVEILAKNFNDGGEESQSKFRFTRTKDGAKYEFIGRVMDDSLERVDECVKMLSRPEELTRIGIKLKEAIAPLGIQMAVNPADIAENKEKVATLYTLFNLDLDSKEGNGLTGKNVGHVTTDGKGKEKQSGGFSEVVSSGRGRMPSDELFVSPDKLRRWFAM